MPNPPEREPDDLKKHLEKSGGAADCGPSWVREGAANGAPSDTKAGERQLFILDSHGDLIQRFGAAVANWRDEPFNGERWRVMCDLGNELRAALPRNDGAPDDIAGETLQGEGDAPFVAFCGTCDESLLEMEVRRTPTCVSCGDPVDMFGAAPTGNEGEDDTETLIGELVSGIVDGFDNSFQRAALLLRAAKFFASRTPEEPEQTLEILADLGHGESVAVPRDVLEKMVAPPDTEEGKNNG